VLGFVVGGGSFVVSSCGELGEKAREEGEPAKKVNVPFDFGGDSRPGVVVQA